MIQTIPEGVFTTSSEKIHSFNIAQRIVTCFVECENDLLVLQRNESKENPHTWCIPGGKCEKNERIENAILRELREETQIELLEECIDLITECYVRSANCGCDYLFAIFRTKLKQKPAIELNFEEHQNSQWIAKKDFCSLNLLPFQKQIFEVVYLQELSEKHGS